MDKQIPVNKQISACYRDTAGVHNFQSICSDVIFCTKCGGSVKLVPVSDDGDAREPTPAA